MGVFGKIWHNIRAFAIQRPPPSPWDDYWYGVGKFETKTGLTIDENTALKYSAVWACVKVISEDLASLPLITYQRLAKGKERAKNHPLFKLLHSAPNPEMNAMQFREASQAHLLTWGNAYSEIERDLLRRPIALWPLNPARMEVKRNDQDELVYEYNLSDGMRHVFSKDEILHIAGLGFNGLIGYPVISYHREAVAFGMATQEYGSRYFDGDSMGRIALSHPGRLSTQAQENLKTAFRQNLGGLSNAWRMIILEEAMKIERLGVPNTDAQYIESRKLSLNDIARIFRVPPHKIMDLERATFSNIEHQGIDYVVSTIRPWAVRWEQCINQRILDNDEKYFVEHLVDALLRGDIKSRYEAYAVGRQWGWLSANDIRELENLNPIIGGDAYLTPMNMQELGNEPKNPDSKGNGKDNGEDKEYRKKTFELMARMSREISDIRKRGGPNANTQTQ